MREISRRLFKLYYSIRVHGMYDILEIDFDKYEAICEMRRLLGERWEFYAKAMLTSMRVREFIIYYIILNFVQYPANIENVRQRGKSSVLSFFLFFFTADVNTRRITVSSLRAVSLSYERLETYLAIPARLVHVTLFPLYATNIRIRAFRGYLRDRRERERKAVLCPASLRRFLGRL